MDLKYFMLAEIMSVQYVNDMDFGREYIQQFLILIQGLKQIPNTFYKNY
jgi:hypothetical protein